MVGARGQGGRREPLRARAGAVPRHVPSLARAAEADDRDGAGRAASRAASMLAWCCDLIVASRRRVLRDPVVKMGIPGRGVLRAPVRAAAARSPRNSCSGRQATTRRARSRSAWSTVSSFGADCSKKRRSALARSIGEMPRFALGARQAGGQPRARIGWACATRWTRPTRCTTSGTRTTRSPRRTTSPGRIPKSMKK